MNWHDLATAACLVLVIEGVMPCLDPARWRATLQAVLALDDRTIRWVGLGSMVLGAVLLQWVS